MRNCSPSTGRRTGPPSSRWRSRRKKTIAATGSTGSGKTSLLRRLMQEIPAEERLVTIEDTDEFGPLPLRNRVSLFYGSANVSAENAVEASLRMRPDRVAMQELRGAEAFAYLRLLAAGHPGGLTTWHAEEGDPFTPLALMAKTSEAGRNIPDDKLLAILRGLIDIVAFCRRDGRRVFGAVGLLPRRRRDAIKRGWSRRRTQSSPRKQMAATDREFEFEIDLTLLRIVVHAANDIVAADIVPRDDTARAGRGGERHAEAPGADCQD